MTPHAWSDTTFAAARPITDTLPVGPDADEPLVADLLGGLPVLEAARAHLAHLSRLVPSVDRVFAAVRAPVVELDPSLPQPAGPTAAERRERILGFADASDLLEEILQDVAKKSGHTAREALALVRTRFACAALDRIGGRRADVVGNKVGGV